MLRPTLCAALCLLAPSAAAQTPAANASAPALGPLVAGTSSELAEVIERFSIDRTVLTHRYDAPDSPDQRRRMRELYAGWQQRLKELDFGKLSSEARADYLLLDRYLRHQIALLDRRDKMRASELPLLPFADRLLALQDARRNLETIDPAGGARVLAAVSKQVDSLRTLFEPSPPQRGDSRPRARGTARQAPRT